MHFVILNLTVIAAVLPIAQINLPASKLAAAEAEKPRQSIEELIETLGAADYVMREYAERELEKYGYEAFEPLRVAQDHDDIEIRYRVERLLHNLRGKLILGKFGETMLKDYQSKLPTVRSAIIDELGLITLEKAVPILCRLARFEESELLSKQAALVIMNEQLPPDTEETFATLITDSVQASTRTATDWLRVYAQSLSKPAGTVDKWDAISQSESAKFNQASETTSESILHDMVLVHVTMLVRAERVDDALALADGRLKEPEDILELVEMFLENKTWNALEKQIAKHQDLFDSDRFFAYRKAEMLRLEKPTTQNERAKQPTSAKSAHSASSVFGCRLRPTRIT